MVSIKIDIFTISERYMDCLEEISYEYKGGEIILYKYFDELGEFFEVQTEINNSIGVIPGTFSTKDEALKAGKNNLDGYWLSVLEAVREDIS